MGTQPLERLRRAYRHGKAQAPQRSGASWKTPQNGECQASADCGDPGISAPAASGALVFANEYRAVRRACGRTLGKNGIGRRAFIEHLDAKLGRDFFQLRREIIRLEKIEIFGKPVTATAHLEYTQAQRFDPPDEVPYAGAGKAQSLAQPLAGVKPAVSQDAKQ